MILHSAAPRAANVVYGSNGRRVGMLRLLSGVSLSFLLHILGALIAAALGLLDQPDPVAPPVARVEITSPLVPLEEPPAIPEAPKKEPNKETRKARARESKQALPKQQPPEIRGGISESLSTEINSPSAPVVSQGNSSEVAVDPTKGDLPPPSTVPIGSNPTQVNYDSIAVEEVFADISADCSGAIPQLDLTDDAINAGVTSGELIFEVIVDDTGKVQQPRLLKGTGYAIDQVATSAVAAVRCAPATAGGQPAVVRKEIRFQVVDF